MPVGHEDFWKQQYKWGWKEEVQYKQVWSTNKVIKGGLEYEVGRNKNGVVLYYKEIPPKIEECF
jgi:hypothetical protein